MQPVGALQLENSRHILPNKIAPGFGVPGVETHLGLIARKYEYPFLVEELARLI